MLWAIARDIEDPPTVSQEQFIKISQIFEDYGKTKDESRLLDQIKHNVPDLVALYDESRGNRAAVRRFTKLGPDKLINIGNYRTDEGKFFITSSDTDFRDEISPLIEDWMTRLIPHSSRRKRKYLIEADAQVLASIQHLNRELKPKQERIVLISGSQSIFDAVNPEAPEGLPSEELRLLQDFSSHYLRHPRWLMANPAFFRESQQEGSIGSELRSSESGSSVLDFDLRRWVDLLSPVTSDKDSRHTRGASNQNIARLRDTWSSHIKSIAALKYGEGLNKAQESGVKKLAKVLMDLKASGLWSVEQLKDELLLDASNLLSELYQNSSTLGLLDVLIEPVRMMPALCFEMPYDSYRQYYKELLHLMTISGAKNKDLRNLISQVDDESENRSPYHIQIIYAAAYGARGHWNQVLTLCADAIAVADRLPPIPGELRRGREAAYLAAIACRRSAKSIADLDKAERYVNEAKSRESAGYPLDIRFESESAAISIRRMYFEHFCSKKVLDLKTVKGEMTVQKELIDRARLQKATNETGTNKFDAAEWVFRQCYTNLLDLALICLKEGDNLVLDDSFRMLFLEFQDTIVPEDRQRDPHGWLVCRVVETILNAGSGQEAVLSAIDERMRRKPRTPYDKARLNLYKEMITSKIL